MGPNLTMITDGKKFLWDGQLYTNKEKVSRTEKSYRDAGFEVQTIEQGGELLIYTRRVVKETVVKS